jgi:hypothetical protein
MKNMKKGNPLRLWLAVCILIVSVSLLVWASWPAPRDFSTVTMPTISALQTVP